jgi:NDP-mannose synthase
LGLNIRYVTEDKLLGTAGAVASSLGLFPREVKIDFGVISTGEQGELVRYTEKPTYNFDVSMAVNVLKRRVVSQFIRHNEYLDLAAA